MSRNENSRARAVPSLRSIARQVGIVFVGVLLSTALMAPLQAVPLSGDATTALPRPAHTPQQPPSTTTTPEEYLTPTPENAPTNTPEPESTSNPTPPRPPAQPAYPVELPAGYEFMFPEGSTATLWDPCDTITYNIDTTNGPPNGESIAVSALNMAAQMTGLSFTRVYSPSAEFTVRYDYQADNPDLAGDVIGTARPSWRGYSNGTREIIAATVYLETDWFSRVSTEEAVAVALHEIGHGLGLAHAATPQSIMYSSAGITAPSADDHIAFRVLNAGC